MTFGFPRMAGEDRRSWLWRAAAAILIANLIDGVLTVSLVSAGLATEANPIMALPLSFSAVAFMIFKMALVSAGVLVLWRLRSRRVASLGLGGLAGAYGLLVVYHVRSMSELARHLRDLPPLLG